MKKKFLIVILSWVVVTTTSLVIGVVEELLSNEELGSDELELCELEAWLEEGCELELCLFLQETKNVEEKVAITIGKTNSFFILFFIIYPFLLTKSLEDMLLPSRLFLLK